MSEAPELALERATIFEIGGLRVVERDRRPPENELCATAREAPADAELWHNSKE